MDPRYSAQEILLCDLCQSAVVQSHCELCHLNLCIVCVGKHLSDSSKRHNVVPYRHRTFAPSYPKCPNHTRKHCELYCEKCDIPVCSTCISSGKHHGHKITDILLKLCSKKKDLKLDLNELEERIYPTYEEMASDIKSKKAYLEKHYEKLAIAVSKEGENWNRDINIIVNKRKSEIEEMKTKHLAALSKQENEIKQITFDVKQSILDLKKILDSSDVSQTSVYKSRNVEFRKLPPKVNVLLPSFSSHQINTEELNQMFGSLSVLSITTEEQGNTVESPCPPVKPLLDEPLLITTTNTWYRQLYSITCLNDEEIWTCGEDNIIKLYNLRGKLLKSVQTMSGNYPRDIAVTRSGELVYTDRDTRTVNIVKNEWIQEVIRLRGWKPYRLCSTSSGDLLVSMLSDIGESKVVRYSGSTEKQTIQYDSKGQRLYSTGCLSKYISENRNMDICVADNTARAVVVVNQAGKLRFRYTGHSSTTKKIFDPCDITTDSQGQILTSDFDNHCIHIIDQDGQFIRYIYQCNLLFPWGLCVDTKDNLLVTEFSSGKVKKIKYM
ncbi:E3 ubiquitin-protein ligase TRIM36-like [Saccostrea echinata]|uniref:E3 ubiquitin-protein ligase TRIM36-like n=1 Tax=Saccostrea echinata TaxID=191078 RepID=UPI002A818C1D|nr:E3 ubiquitin-protein ligase TRIM36-like [Saccostrea echinata]